MALGLLLRNLIKRMLCGLHGVLDVRDRTLYVAGTFVVLPPTACSILPFAFLLNSPI